MRKKNIFMNMFQQACRRITIQKDNNYTHIILRRNKKKKKRKVKKRFYFSKVSRAIVAICLASASKIDDKPALPQFSAGSGNNLFPLGVVRECGSPKSRLMI